jgi:cell division protein FtsB
MAVYTNITKKIVSWFTLGNILPLGVVLIAFWWVWGTIDVIQQNFQYQQQVDQLNQQVTLLKLENTTEEYKIAYYRTSEYDQLEARAYLDKAAPGEKELILPSTETNILSTNNGVNEEQPTLPTEPTQQPSSNFEQWLSFLFSKH